MFLKCYNKIHIPCFETWVKSLQNQFYRLTVRRRLNMNLNSKKAHVLAVLLVSSILLFQMAASLPVGWGWTTSDGLDVGVDVGSIHFRGETAEFYVLVSSAGERVDASVCANLFFNGSLFACLSGSVQHVTTGLYRIPYVIPLNASAGEYALVVDVSKCGVEGSGLKVFEVNPTLSGWNAWILEINNNVLTVKTDVNTIKLDLASINATIVNIDGRVVTIETDVGIVKADLDTLNVALTKIEGDVTTISTSVGSIQGDITSIANNVVTITTAIGDLQFSLTELNSTLVSLNQTMVTKHPLAPATFWLHPNKALKRL